MLHFEHKNYVTIIVKFGRGGLAHVVIRGCAIILRTFWSAPRGALECNLTGRCPFFESPQPVQEKICILIDLFRNF